MTFFSGITNERKIHAIDARLLGVKEQLYSVLVTTGLDPDDIDMSTFNPDTDLPENSVSLAEDVKRIISIINQIEELKAKVTG